MRPELREDSPQKHFPKAPQRDRLFVALTPERPHPFVIAPRSPDIGARTGTVGG